MLAEISGRRCLGCKVPGEVGRIGCVGKTPDGEGRHGMSRWSSWWIEKRCVDGRGVQVEIVRTALVV